MLHRLRRFEEGGQAPDPMQILQAYAQANQMDEETFGQFVQEFQSMAPQEQQKVLQVISQQLQQMQQQAPQQGMQMGEEAQMEQQQGNPMMAQMGARIGDAIYDPIFKTYHLPKAAYGIDPSQYPVVKPPVKQAAKSKVPVRQATAPVAPSAPQDELDMLKQRADSLKKDPIKETIKTNIKTSNFPKSLDTDGSNLHPLGGKLNKTFYDNHITGLNKIKGLRNAIPIETVKGDLVYYNYDTGKYGAIGLPGRMGYNQISDFGEILDPSGVANYGDSRAAKYNKLLSNQGWQNADGSRGESSTGESIYNSFDKGINILGNIPAIGKTKGIIKGGSSVLGKVFEKGSGLLKKIGIMDDENTILSKIEKAKVRLGEHLPTYKKLEDLENVKKEWGESSKQYQVAKAVYQGEKKMLSKENEALKKQSLLYAEQQKMLTDAPYHPLISDPMHPLVNGATTALTVEEKAKKLDELSVLKGKVDSELQLSNLKIKELKTKLGEPTLDLLQKWNIVDKNKRTIEKQLSVLDKSDISKLTEHLNKNKKLIEKYRKIPEGLRKTTDIDKAFEGVSKPALKIIHDIIKAPYEKGNGLRTGFGAILQTINQDETK